MNNAGFSVTANPIAAGAQGPKPAAGKQAALQGSEGDSPDSRKLLNFQHYSRSAKAKDDPEDQAQDDQGAATTLPTAPAVIFDSLFMQMEKKMTGQSQPSQPEAGGLSAGQAAAPNAQATSGATAKLDVAGAKLLQFPQNLARRAGDQGKAAPASGQQLETPSTASIAMVKVTGHGKSAVLNDDGMSAFSGLQVDQQVGEEGPQEQPDAGRARGTAQGLSARTAAAKHGDGLAAERDAQDNPDQSGQDHGKNTPASAVPTAGLGASSASLARMPEAASQASSPSLVDQISHAINSDAVAADAGSLAEKDHKTIVLRLAPEGLGRLSIRLEKTDGVLKVSFSAEHESTSESLKAASPELARALESSIPGFSANDLSFSTMPQPDSEARQNFGQGGLNAGVAGNEQKREQSSGQQQAANTPPAFSLSSLGETANESRSPGLRPGRYGGGALYV